ncbi:MAG: trehalose-phosphatase [Candidatus Methylomirabilia bacterium]
MAKARFPLLGAAGREALRVFVDRATLFAFDLDGTLAPIVPEPSRVVVPDAVRERLVRLDRMAPVVVVTGRGRADARRRLRFRPRHLVGNHGAEGLPGRASAERGYRRLGERWTAQLRALLPDPRALGVVVEDKGATLSLHYRNATDQARARRVILRAALRLAPPPRSVHGKFVENLLPRDAPDKGEALAAVMRHLGCRRALYVGDDETDEDVFRLDATAVLGVRVGPKAGSAARAYLRDQSEIGPLLDEILSLLTEPPHKVSAAGCRPRSGQRPRAGPG